MGRRHPTCRPLIASPGARLVAGGGRRAAGHADEQSELFMAWHVEEFRFPRENWIWCSCNLVIDVMVII